jgi:hypothetical protein
LFAVRVFSLSFFFSFSMRPRFFTAFMRMLTRAFFVMLCHKYLLQIGDSTPLPETHSEFFAVKFD